MTIYSIDAKVFEFELSLEKGISWPKFKFNTDYRLASETSINENLKKINIIFSNFDNEIILSYYNKTPNDTVFENDQIVHDQNIKISKLWVNNVQLDLEIIKNNFIFYPKYNNQHILNCLKQNIELPKSINTTDLHHNGNLHFQVHQPFFQWYNATELQILNSVNKFVKYSHLGIGDENTLLTLEKINNLLK